MLPAPVETWLAEHLGNVRSVRSLSSTQGSVWRVTLDRSEDVTVKQGPTSAIDREAWGLNAATPIGAVPIIRGRPSRDTIVMSARPGGPHTSPEVMTSAGAWLRRLHRLRTRDDDPLPLPEALAKRRDAWLARAASDLEPPALDFAAFADIPRVACHRDFTPSNWLWDPDAKLSVIDFGQARPDAALWDLVKLEGETFRERPQLRASFYEGYGRLDAGDASRLRTLVLLHGLQTAVWGDTHGDATFSGLGRAILEM